MAAPAPCDAGWSRALYDSACAACEAAPGDAPLAPALARSLGVPYEALSSLWHQMHSARVRKSAHGHRERAGEYAAAWAGGESLPAIASRVGFPPFLVAPSSRASWGSAADAGDVVRAPARIADARLRRDVEACAATDAHCAPRHDAARRAVGVEYEMLLRGALERSARPSSTRTTCGAGLLEDAGPLGYVNRLGAGAVVYWFGFCDELQDLDDDVRLLRDWPPPGALFWPDARPCAPPAVAAPTQRPIDAYFPRARAATAT
ncbi:hypothetical protein JL720_2461 [Aureococcus anophagefferens]|nr:hypothetical protein JL720_2461 [Aureococcus anophagefferens]